MTTAVGTVPPEGLSTEEAARRLRADGPNTLPAPAVTPWWRNLLAQLTHFFAVLLWVAAVLAIIGGMPQLGVAIIVVVLVNGTFAFLQEHRADRAASRLRTLLPRRARVRRDGRVTDIDAAELVVGDVVLLSAGDRISADLEVRAARSFAVDNSMLTGESLPVWPEPGDTVVAGTFAVTGEAETVVLATGATTRLGGIVELTHLAHRPVSPLTLELHRVVRAVALIAVGCGLFFFLVAWLVGIGPGDGFLFAVGVTVALVPEGLLPTVTLSLARGAQRMADRNALVRRLESVETLGSTTFICTDKTGTLTCNRMTVAGVWAPADSAALFRASARCTSVEVDPMERALLEHAAANGFDVSADEVDHPLVGRIPFDTHRRRMSVLVGTELLVKGAPEAVLPLCHDSERAAIHAQTLAERGLRVLAVARRVVAAGEPLDVTAERDLELLGFLGLEDPPRPGIRDAITACRRAGIRVAMVTGDHPATAAAIAREVGLSNGSTVIDGAALPEDDEVLGALLDRDGVIVSRVEPEAKLRIARALQRRGHVVAMTGDGVNDGPALQEADIGVAMGRSGTDVAREAADLVLLDDDFATIVAAIAEGRATYSNIHRFLTYHLTDNVAELTPFLVWALSGGNFPLALGVLQILALDIGTDLLPALALGAEAPSPAVLDRPPVARHLIDRPLLVRVFGVLGAAEAAVEMTAFTVALLLAGWRPDGDIADSDLFAASGAAFTAVVVGQMANAFACRSATQPPWKLAWRSNPLLVGAVAVELAALVTFLAIPGIAHVLDQRLPALVPALVALAAAPAVLAVDAAYKAVRRLRTEDPGRRVATGGR